MGSLRGGAQGRVKARALQNESVKEVQDPLQRQIGESLEIERRGGTNDLLLNSKGEWNGTRRPGLTQLGS